MAISRSRSRSATSPTNWSSACARRHGRSRSAPGSRPTPRWARSITAASRDRITGFIDATSADIVVDGRALKLGRRRLLGRPDAAGRRHDRHGRLPRGDLRAGARRRARRHAGRGDRADQRQRRTPTAPRSSPAPGRRRATFQRRDPGRHDRHQRPDPGADGLLLASAAGRTRCSATTTSTDRKACGSTPGRRRSRRVGRTSPTRSTSTSPRPDDCVMS